MIETIDAEIIEEVVIPILKDTILPYKSSYVDELVEKFKTPIILNAEDGETKSYKIVKDGSILLSKVINAIEKERKLLTEPALKYQKETKAKFDKEKNKLIAIRDLLKTERAKVDNYVLQQKIESEAKEELRISNIREIINAYEKLPMLCIGKSSSEILRIKNLSNAPTATLLEEHFDEAVQIHYESQTKLQQMIDDRILVENAEQIQADAKEKADKQEAENQAIRDAEQAKLEKEKAEFQKQKDDFEALQRAVQEKADRQDAELKADALQAQQEADIKENQEKIDNFIFPREMYIVVAPQNSTGELKAFSYESMSITRKDAIKFRDRINKNGKIYKAVELI